MSPTVEICCIGALAGLGAIDLLCFAARGLRSMWSRDWPEDVRVGVSLSVSRNAPSSGAAGGNGGDAVLTTHSGLVDLPILPTMRSAAVAGFDRGEDLGSSQQELVVISITPGVTEEDLRDAFLRAYESATTRLGFTNAKLWEQSEPTFRHLDVRQDA